MHISVLKNEVIDIFNPQPNQNYIDCTFGQGGHTFAILEKTKEKGKIIAFDLSKDQTNKNQKAKEYIAEGRLKIVNKNFVNLKKVIKKEKFGNVDGILFDLGFSSWHLELSGRGFAFQNDEPLDMRYDNLNQKLTALEIVNSWSADEICQLLKEYGDERYARLITNKIREVRKREKIYRTKDLVKIIENSVPGEYRRRKIHCATKTFQALRIAVNDELNNLKIALPQALEILKKGGIIITIAFHSLEDRIIKNYFRDEAKKGRAKLLFKKPLIPTDEEIRKNPRSRSAKLRAVMKLS